MKIQTTAMPGHQPAWPSVFIGQYVPSWNVASGMSPCYFRVMLFQADCISALVAITGVCSFSFVRKASLRTLSLRYSASSP